jgi:hypothetical protein
MPRPRPRAMRRNSLRAAAACLALTVVVPSRPPPQRHSMIQRFMRLSPSAAAYSTGGASPDSARHPRDFVGARSDLADETGEMPRAAASPTLATNTMRIRAPPALPNTPSIRPLSDSSDDCRFFAPAAASRWGWPSRSPRHRADSNRKRRLHSDQSMVRMALLAAVDFLEAAAVL